MTGGPAQDGLDLEYTVRFRGRLTVAGQRIVLESETLRLDASRLYAVTYRLRLAHPGMAWDVIHVTEE